MHPKYFLFTLALFTSFAALANGPYVPDPAGTASFKSVSLQTATPGPDNVSTDCDPAYRQAVEQGFSSAWNQCVAIGKGEPSDCQRALFQTCTKAANDMRGRQGATCSVMASAAGTISKAGDTLTQNSSEAQNSTVNKEAAAAMRKVASQVDGDAASIGSAVKVSGGLLKGALCNLSSSTAQYTQLEAKMNEAFTNTQNSLKQIAEAKRAKANGYDGTSKASTTNVAAMQSTNPQKVGPGSATSPYAGMDSGSGGGSSAGSSGVSKALPLLGAGIPAAVLTGVALNGGSFGNSSAKDPVPAAYILRDAGISVTGSLTDRQKTVVALAMQKIPECQRQKLKGLNIRTADLKKQGQAAGGCIAGLWIPGTNPHTIALDPTCGPQPGGGVTVSVVVHEFYHELGHKNGQALHNAYKRPYQNYPNCPVSHYGGTNFYEDFAEAGRLVSVPDNDRTSAACGSSKVSELNSIVKSCQ